MTTVNLPNLNVTGPNLWSQVQGNDQAIANVVNGNIDATNLADGAVTTAKVANGAITAEKLASGVGGTPTDGSVTTAKLANGAVTGDKIAASTTASVTFTNGAADGSPGALARKYANGLVVLQGGFLKVAASKNTGYVTLPAGYRPPDTRHFAIACEETEQVVRAIVSSNGVITLDWPGTPTPPFAFYLDGISFHAG